MFSINIFIIKQKVIYFQDDTQKQDLEKINHDIDGKLDRTELDALRDYMDKQLKKLKKLAVSFVKKFFRLVVKQIACFCLRTK